jgi:hypothetical protein
MERKQPFRDAQIPRTTNFFLRWRLKHFSDFTAVQPTPLMVHTVPHHPSTIHYIVARTCLMPVDRHSCSTLSLLCALHCVTSFTALSYFTHIVLSYFCGFRCLLTPSLKSCNPGEVTVFNIHRSVRHRDNILLYKSQHDAQVTEFI